MIKITLLRHGRSRADDEKVHEGRYDSPLTVLGLKQAQKRLEDFRAMGFTFDRIISSPLIRAKAVAEVMSEGLDVPLETDTDWMEMDNGLLAGLPFEEADQKFPTPSFLGPYERPFHGTGESQWELYVRAARAVQRVVSLGPGSYLVVAHGGILNSALRTMLGIQPLVNNHGTWFAFADLGYAALEYNPANHQWWMLQFNTGFISDSST